MTTIGIDLGTTYSSVAVMKEEGTVEILDNQEGEKLTPSVVYFQDFGNGEDVPLVGREAKNQAALAPNCIVDFIKRFMGDSTYVFDSPTGNEYKPEEISAIILKKLKEGAELALGEKIENAVITVPAYFDDVRRTATRQAGEMAGLKVSRIINEPTAAALAYGINNNQKKEDIIVYDLGGGTFDVTLMEINGNDFNVIATDGDRNLGGFDFDNIIINMIIDDIKQQNKDVIVDEELAALIREKAEQAKKSLTNVENTLVHLTIDKKPFKTSISRSRFEELSKDLLDRTFEIMSDVLDESEKDIKDINEILLIGGSTRMPMVKNRINKEYGIDVTYKINPDEAVAIGAAIQGSIEDIKSKNEDNNSQDDFNDEIYSRILSLNISDVTSQSLGVISLDQDNKEINNILIKRNSKIPCNGISELMTVGKTDTLLFRVTEGDDEDIRYVNIIGEATVNLGRTVEKGYPFKLSYSYDIDQTIFAELYTIDDKLIGTFQVSRNNNMEDEQVKILKEKINSTEVY